MAGQEPGEIGRTNGERDLAQDFPLVLNLMQADIAVVAHPGTINRFLQHEAHMHRCERAIVCYKLILGVLLRRKIRCGQPCVNGCACCVVDLEGTGRGNGESRERAASSTQSDHCQGSRTVATLRPIVGASFRPGVRPLRRFSFQISPYTRTPLMSSVFAHLRIQTRKTDLMSDATAPPRSDLGRSSHHRHPSDPQRAPRSTRTPRAARSASTCSKQVSSAPTYSGGQMPTRVNRPSNTRRAAAVQV